MTEFIYSLSFSKLISHVFPGFLLIISIFLVIDSFCTDPGFYTCKMFENYNLEIFIITIGFFFIIGTIIGVIVDGIQHITITVLFDKLFKKFSKLYGHYAKIYDIVSSTISEELFSKYEKTINNEQISIKSELEELNKINLPLLNWTFYVPFINTEIFKIFNEEYYHYYEFFANISLVLPITSLSILFYSNNVIDISFNSSLLFFAIVIFINLVCIYISWKLFYICLQIRINILLGTIVEKEIKI